MYFNKHSVCSTYFYDIKCCKCILLNTDDDVLLLYILMFGSVVRITKLMGHLQCTVEMFSNNATYVSIFSYYIVMCYVNIF